jgi:hypothetical protein
MPSPPEIPTPTKEKSLMSTDPDEIFNLDAQRSIPYRDYGTEEISTRRPVRKPGKDEFFRTHPGLRVDLTLLEYHTEEERRQYMIHPNIYGELEASELAVNLKRVRIIASVNRNGTVFLWPLTLPTGGSNSGRTWHESALEIAEEATRFWVKMAGDRAVGAYKYWKASGDLGEPQWGDLNLESLLRTGFKDRAIITLEHEVIRELRGEK